jgi:hypothetical protein
MALDRAVLERQLSEIRSNLTACEQALNSAGVAQDQMFRQPAWRHWDANRRQITRRLRAAAAVAQRGERTKAES